MNATHAVVENEFKKFGNIRSGGIQIRIQKVCLSITITFIVKLNMVSINILLMHYDRDFVLDLWNLKKKLLCKVQLR